MSDDAKKGKKDGSDHSKHGKSESTHSKHAHADVYDEKHSAKHPAKPDPKHESKAEHGHGSRGIFAAVEQFAKHPGKEIASVVSTISEAHKAWQQKAEAALKLSPEQRAKQHQQDGIDTKNHVTYKYDDRGRITDCTNSGGRHIHYDYSGAGKVPSKFHVEQPPKGITESRELDPKTTVLDQETGRLRFTTTEKQSTVEHDINADGSGVAIVRDLDGKRLAKQTYSKDDHGNIHVDSTVQYQYVDGRAVAVIADGNNRIRHQYVFENAQAIEKQHPKQETEFTYSTDDPKAPKTRFSESSHTYDLSSGKRVLVAASERTVDLETRTTAFTNQSFDAKGKELSRSEFTFDSKGMPASFHYVDATQKIDATVQFDEKGLPKDVVSAKGKLDPSTEAQLKAFAFANKTALEQSGKVGPVDQSLVYTQGGPTQPGDGTHPASGTLVWKGKDGYHQATVRDGNILDAQGKKIGTFADNGNVSLDGQPPFNILQNKDMMAAFHGTEANKRMDLVFNQSTEPGKRTEGLTGMFTNGTESCSVVGGNMYDSKGKFIGHLNSDGKIEFPTDAQPPQQPKDINSYFHGGWQFQGTEDGYSRTFDVNQKTTNGKIFLPPADGGPSVQYEVRMGMIINPKTHEEIGRFIPPDDVNGRLEGGYIITGTPPKAVPLAQYSKAVFDVELIGQTGIHARHISGAAPGAEVQADGSYRPGTALVNLQQQSDAADKYAADKILASGQFDEAMIRRLRKEQTTGEQHFLEPLPTDLSRTNGTLKRPDGSQPNGVAEYDVRAGKIYKKGTNELVGSINGSDGSMTWMKDGKPEQTSMRQMSGAVWHLEYQADDKSQQKVDWITAENGTIYSAAELRKQAAAETERAKNFNEGNHSELSEQAYSRGQDLERRFNGKIDEILRNGIAADSNGQLKGDGLKQIAEGPSKHVRAELFREKEPPLPHTTSVPELKTPQDCSRVNGQARIGNDQYEIQHGKLYRVHVENGERVVEKTSCGELQSGYVAEVDGHKINLNRENQVLLQFKLEGDDHLHRVIGMGPARTDVGGARVSGGLVEANDLLRQSYQAIQEGQNGNAEYFKRAGVTGVFADAAMGGRYDQLRQVAESMQTQADAVKQNIDRLFRDGFSTTPMDNNMIDGNVRGIQIFMKDLNVSAQDMTSLGSEGAHLQDQMTEAEVMVALMVVTAGSGAAITAGAEALGTTVSGITFYGGQILAGMVGGGVISAEMRTNAGERGSEQYWRNFGSGVLEGGTMAAGTVGGQYLTRLTNINQMLQAGQALTKADMMFLASPAGQKALQVMSQYGSAVMGGYKVANAFTQTVGFTAAGGVRDGNIMQGMTMERIITGTGWMLAGDLLAGKLMPGAAAIEAETTAFGRFIKTAPSEFVNNFTVTGLSGMHDAVENQRRILAEKFHVPVEAISNEMLERLMDHQQVLNDMAQAGAQGAMLTPITSAVHQGVREFEAHRSRSRTVIRDNTVETVVRNANGQIEALPKPDFVELKAPKKGMSAEFVEQANQAISSIPPELREFVKAQGNKIVLAHNLVDGDASLTGPMRGHPSSHTWLNNSGVYVPANSHVVVSEKMINPSTGKWVRAENPGGAIRHEFGHALDNSLNRVSESPQFMAIYMRERANVLAHATPHEQRVLDYFVQQSDPTGRNGASEAFAELFSTLHGESGAPWARQELLRYFPDTLRFIEQKAQDVIAAQQALTPSHGPAGPASPASPVPAEAGPPSWYLFQQSQQNKGAAFNEHLANQMQRDVARQQEAAEMSVPNETGTPTTQEVMPPHTTPSTPDYVQRWEQIRQIQESRRGSRGGTQIGGIEPMPAPSRELPIYASIPNDRSRAHLKADIEHFSERMITKSGVTENMTREQEQARMKVVERQISETLRNVEEMLADRNDTWLSLSDRQRLAEEVMFMASMPTLIDQGVHPTCNVTVAEVRMYLQHPEIVTRIMKEIALHGQFTDGEGKVFKLRDSMRNPDEEAVRNRNSGTTKLFTEKSGLFGKTKQVGNRLYASQLLQNALVEKHWIEKTGSLGFNGMRVIDLKSGNPVHDYDTADMSSFEVQQLLSRLTGKSENFILVNSHADPEAVKQKLVDAAHIYSNPEELLRLIKESKGHAGLTIEATTESGQKGPHFISVLGVRIKSLKPNPAPNEIIVTIDDQWGKGRDQMTLQELYDATLAAGQYM